MRNEHLSPEALGEFLEDEEYGKKGTVHPHLAICSDCRATLAALIETARRLAPTVPEPSTARWREAEAALTAPLATAVSKRRLARWTPSMGAAAAVVLLALAWPLLRQPHPPSEASMLPAEPNRDGGPLYLSPDCWVASGPGARVIRSGDILRLESGGVTLSNLGWRPVSVETSLGTLRGVPGEAVQAEIRMSASDRKADQELATLFLGSAQAGDAPGPELEVTVRFGLLRLEVPNRALLEIPAGRRMCLATGREIRWEDVPKAEAPAWTLQRMNPPLELTGNPAFLPFPALPAGGYAWEMEVLAPASSSSLGVTFETEGKLRLWHLGSEAWAGPPRWRRLRVSVRGSWAEIWADGRLLLSTEQAPRRFQNAPVTKPGLVVWGTAQVRQIRGGLLP